LQILQPSEVSIDFGEPQNRVNAVRAIILIAATLLIASTSLKADITMTVNGPGGSNGSNAKSGPGVPNQSVFTSLPFEADAYSTSGGSDFASASLNASWDGSLLHADGDVGALSSGSFGYSVLSLTFSVDESYDAVFSLSTGDSFYISTYSLRRASDNSIVYSYNGSNPTWSGILPEGDYLFNLHFRANTFSPDDYQYGAFVTNTTFTPTVVPEPSTYVLVLGGLALVVALRRRVSARS
jgi:hypothetical protein